MKVKSFCFIVVDGYGATIELLDLAVAGLAAKNIHSVKDTFYPATSTSGGRELGPSIVRVVLYDD